MSNSWSRNSHTGNGRRPPYYGNSNNEDGEIYWGPSRTDSSVRVNGGGDSQSQAQAPPRSDPRTDRTNYNSYHAGTGVPTGVPTPTGVRTIPFRNDRDPRFKASSASGRFHHSSAVNNPTNNSFYSNPGRRVTSDSYSPKNSGVSNNPQHNVSISRNFSVPDGGSRYEFNDSFDGRDQGSPPVVLDGIGVPIPGPRSSSGLGTVGGGGSKPFWRSTSALNTGPSGGSNSILWTESGTREKKFTPWSSKPSFPPAHVTSLQEGFKSLDSESDTKLPISKSEVTPFLNKFDRRAPPGGWERDRNTQQTGTGASGDGSSSNNQDYYGPSIGVSSRDRPLVHDTGLRDEKRIETQTFYPSEYRRYDDDLSQSLPKNPSEQDGVDIDGGHDVVSYSDSLPIGQDSSSSRDIQEIKDIKDGGTISLVRIPDVKQNVPEFPNPPPSPDKKTVNTVRITISSLAHEEKINKAESAVRRLSDIISQDDINSQVDGSLVLPSSQQIMLGVSHIDLRIKESERELAQLRTESEELLKKEEEERVQQIQKELERKIKREVEITQKYEKTRKIEHQKRDIDREKYRNELNMLQSSIQDLTSKRNAQASEVQEEFKVSFSREFDQMNALVLIHIQAAHILRWNELAPHIQTFIEQLKFNLEAEISIINETALILKSLGSDDKLCEEYIMTVNESDDDSGVAITSKLEALSSMLKDEPMLMADVVSSVLLESRKRARQSHLDTLSLIPIDDTRFTPSEDEHNWSNENWSLLARSVTGPENALYIEPSEAPLFRETHTQYLQDRELVRDHIRSKKRRLHNRWKELSLEYLNIQRSTVNELPEFVGIATEIIISDPDAPDLGVRGNNPYRRPRRVANLGTGSNTMGSDVVRSEYEQEQIIAKLTAQEALEKKIIHGGCPLPRQRCQLENSLFISYHDSLSSRRVYDPVEESEDLRCRNPWSDMEKCIFLDKFLQHPKDFRKIASYLKNKSVRDCICFYYDSKQSVPYKAALKDHLIRRKRRGEPTNWEATMQAAVSVGATLSTGISSEKPVTFSVPIDDNTYSRRYFHPLRRERIINVAAESPSLTPTHADHDENTKTIAIPVGKLFTVDISPVPFPVLNLDAEKEINQDGSSCDSESQIGQSTIEKDDKALVESSHRKIQKWTKEEKKRFLCAFDQYGKKWSLLAEAVGTKNVNQIKNYYYDNKKVIGKRVVLKESVNDQDILSLRDKEKIEAVHNLNDSDISGRVPSVNDIMSVGGRSYDAFNYLHLDTLAHQQSDIWTHPSLHHPLALAIERHHQNQISGYHHVQTYDFPVYSQSYGLPYLDQSLLLSQQVHDRAWEQALQRAYIHNNSQVDIGSIASWANGRQQHEVNFALPDNSNYMLFQQMQPVYHHPFVADISPRINNTNFDRGDNLDRFDNFHMNN